MMHLFINMDFDQHLVTNYGRITTLLNTDSQKEGLYAVDEAVLIVVLIFYLNSCTCVANLCHFTNLTI